MLEIVKNMHFPADGLRSYYLVRLGHLSSSVDFTLMVNLNFYLNALLFVILPHYFGWLSLRIIV